VLLCVRLVVLGVRLVAGPTVGYCGLFLFGMPVVAVIEVRSEVEGRRSGAILTVANVVVIAGVWS
jgi:biotin transporter BioY